MASRYQVTPEDRVPTGVCECGCGGQTLIADRTNHLWRYFIGHPKPFLKGHHARNGRFSKRGPEAVAWKGGRYKSTRGYIYIYRPKHPLANSDGHVLEHRLVAEETIGRFLTRKEQVHHINGIRDDNRPENLVVLTASAHAKEHGWNLGQYTTPEEKSTNGRKGASVRWGFEIGRTETRTCHRGGETFDVLPSSKHVNCPEHRNAKAPANLKLCPSCGTSFRSAPSSLRRFCSRQCRVFAIAAKKLVSSGRIRH